MLKGYLQENGTTTPDRKAFFSLHSEKLRVDTTRFASVVVLL